MGFSAETGYTAPAPATQRPRERVKNLDTGIYLIPLFGRSETEETVLTTPEGTVTLSDAISPIGCLDLSVFTGFNSGDYGRVSVVLAEQYHTDTFKEHRGAIAVYLPTFTQTEFEVYEFTVTAGEAVLTLPAFLTLTEIDDPAWAGE